MRAFRLAYDGRPFHGFQRQPDVPTVEGALLDALDELGLRPPNAAVPRGYAAAGRTDAGVSAVAQTVAFECPGWCGPNALNGALPDAVRAWASAEVPATFHATHDATRRTYVYFLATTDADLAMARAAADRLSGEHDFHNLTSADRGTVRDLELTVELDGGFLAITAASDGFPRHLVRRIASLVGAAAEGDSSLERIDRVLASEPLDGPEGVRLAPAAGLVLIDVAYPEVRFAIDEPARESARIAFHERRAAARTTARAAARIIEGLDAT